MNEERQRSLKFPPRRSVKQSVRPPGASRRSLKPKDPLAGQAPQQAPAASAPASAAKPRISLAGKDSSRSLDSSSGKAPQAPPPPPPPPPPVKPKPLDISNGRAVYKKYAKCFYNSASLGKWVEATVIMVNESGEIMIDTKEEYWFSIQEQQEKFRPCGSKSYKAGEMVQYNSVTQRTWLDCKVVAVDPATHAIQVSVKENYWIKVEEQKEKVRPPVRQGIEELLWEAGQLLDTEPPDPPDAVAAEKKYRKVLQKEDDNMKAMEGLAILLRDYRGDFSAAETVYVQALEENPYEMKMLSDYGDLLVVQGRKEEAARLYERLRKVRLKLREFQEESRAADDDDEDDDEDDEGA